MKKLLGTVALAAALVGGIGFASAIADPPPSPPGQGECAHGNSGKECKPDPQPTHGQDCDEHGPKDGGVNEDHCLGATTTPETSSTTSTTTRTETTPSTPTTTQGSTSTPTTPISGPTTSTSTEATAGTTTSTPAAPTPDAAPPVKPAKAKPGKATPTTRANRAAAHLPYTGLSLKEIVVLGIALLVVGLLLMAAGLNVAAARGDKGLR